MAHGQRVAHRDIKPANVFLLTDPGGPRVKLLDFGIAKIMKDGESVGTKGTLGSFTWLYAAPEQVDPRYGATGLATDVYAFALLVTELMTDRAPADGADFVSIMRAATDPRRRPTPRVRGIEIPDALEEVLAKALAVDPRSRFPSIVELWEALGRVRGARASGAPSVGSMPASVYARPSLPTHGLGPASATVTSAPRSPPLGTPPPHAARVPPNLGGPPPGPPPNIHRPPGLTVGAAPFLPARIAPPLHARRLGEATNPWFVGLVVLAAVGSVLVGSCVACGTCAAMSQQQRR